MEHLRDEWDKVAPKIKSAPNYTVRSTFAERKRFELSIQLPIYYLSRVAPSTTRTPLCVLESGCKDRLCRFISKERS
jgi:hypothetical protein